MTLEQELIDGFIERLERLQTTHESLITRISRVESKLVQLMKFQGMQTDGRKQLKEDHVERY